MTLLRGQTLLSEGRLRQEPGYGRYLSRISPQPPVAGAVR
jgi:hypothetical protein